MTEHPMVTRIRQEMAELEAMKRQRGVMTPRLLAECLPPTLRNMMSMYEFKETADRINLALSDTPIPHHDSKARASGEKE